MVNTGLRPLVSAIIASSSLCVTFSRIWLGNKNYQLALIKQRAIINFCKLKYVSDLNINVSSTYVYDTLTSINLNVFIPGSREWVTVVCSQRWIDILILY